MTAAGSVLVAGSFQPETQMDTKKVRVLRPFYYRGQVLEKDSVVDLPKVFAAEVCASRKGEAVADEPAPQPRAAPVPHAPQQTERKEK
jgi:hypothetical protein